MAILPPPRRALAGLAAALLVCGCAARGAPAAAPAQPSHSRTADLSHVVRQDVPYRAGEPPTQLDRAADGTVVRLSIGARTGSLLRLAAAPDSAVRTVDQLSSLDLVLPAVVLDMRDAAQDQPGYRLRASDLAGWERANGPVPAGAMVLLVTGWDVRWGDPAAYLNQDAAGAPQVPGFDAAVAALLLNERGAAGLGLDAPGAFLAPASGYRLLLENLTGLEQLPATGATLVIGALKLQAAQASPARVLALVP